MCVCLFKSNNRRQKKPIVKSHSQEKSTSGSVFWTELDTGHSVSIKIETQTKELNQVTVVNNKNGLKARQLCVKLMEPCHTQIERKNIEHKCLPLSSCILFFAFIRFDNFLSSSVLSFQAVKATNVVGGGEAVFAGGAGKEQSGGTEK